MEEETKKLHYALLFIYTDISYYLTSFHLLSWKVKCNTFGFSENTHKARCFKESVIQL